MSDVIRLTRGGDIITMGRVTINGRGHAQVFQRTDTVKNYRFEWGDYFTAGDDDVVTIDIFANRATAALTDKVVENGAEVSISEPSVCMAYLKLSVAITGGETFIIHLDITGELPGE